MEISIDLLVMWLKVYIWDHIYPGLFIEISTKLFVMWQKAKVWDHILSRPVHGNFHRSTSDVVKSLHMGSYFIQACLWKFPQCC